MLRLYNKLSEYDVIMSLHAYNEYQMVNIKFEKGPVSRRYVYTYDQACNPIRWQDMLIGHLAEFMFAYEQECIKHNWAMDLRGDLWKEE